LCLFFICCKLIKDGVSRAFFGDISRIKVVSTMDSGQKLVQVCDFEMALSVCLDVLDVAIITFKVEHPTYEINNNNFFLKKKNILPVDIERSIIE